MQQVITLIAAPGAESALRGCVAALGGTADWLAPGACDISGASEEAARVAIVGEPIDIVAQPVAGRRKKLLVADLESTIIENEMLEELADFLGLRVHVAEITRRAMNGEIDFVAALTERVALLRGLSENVLHDAASRIRIMPGARPLIATLRRAGVTTALVSGGFTVFAERIAADLGFDRVVANRLDIADGKLAGTVSPPIVTAATKHDTLVVLAKELGIGLEATLAVGDGANDLPMLQAAGFGVAFRAKPAVATAARWRIDHADLTALLYAQGYRQEEIVAT
ncbi:MAG TPA: phosphoserine phosphatase SerB [Stellaceae bacterium]|jgi:phosphoserine phosphatase|nr:phosphoserine phosphatase SerB [Stellaceae bacterium]